jgi:adenylate kinase
MRLVLLGAPGSGKGTQGVALAEHFGIPHVSSGDLLRMHIADRTELGLEVAGFVTKGELVPDDLVLRVIGEAVVAAIAFGGYVLDGFPRTLDQAERGYQLAASAGTAAEAAIFLAVSDAVARQRLGARAEGRSDDADPDVIERRLQLFHEETGPLLTHYEDRGIMVTIDATQPPDAVLVAILRALAPFETQ